MTRYLNISIFLLLAVSTIAQEKKVSENSAQLSRVIEADYNKTSGPLSQTYSLCVGAGRASEGLRADWQQQLTLIKKELGFKYIRFHGLLNDEMYVYTVDKAGKEHYNWQYVDKLYDFLLSIGVRPFVELGFMPPDLASGTKTVFWWKGNVTPPKSYEKWSALITALVKHFEERYGREEVNKWYFEIWNEPDLKGFFDGTQDEYFKLYQVTANAVKSVSTSYKVGGPATARNPWIKPFLKFCEESKAPLDFVSTHSYNTRSVFDEFGTGHRTLLPRGFVSDAVRKVRRMIDSTVYKGMELHYTEFNSSPSSRDPLHDTYENAAWLLNTLKRTEDSATSMSYWTFTDIFEEAGPGKTPFHGGFGLLNLQSIKKPSFYAYKFMRELGETELTNADADSWICKSKNGVQMLFWNMELPFEDTTIFDDVYFRQLHPAPEAGSVNVRLKNLPNGNYDMIIYKVGYHSNDPFTAYLEMGSPYSLSRKQEAELKKLSTGEPISRTRVNITDGKFSKSFKVNENDIFLVKLVKL